MTKAKTGWTTCPICRTRLKVGKLEGHLENVHPKGTNVPGARHRVQQRKQTTSNIGRAAVIVAVIIVIILLLFVIFTHQSPRHADVGEKPHSFTLPDQNGKDYALSDHIGTRPLLLAFMSSTCQHCAVMAEVMQALFENYSSQVEFVLSISNTDASADDCYSFHVSHHLEFPTLYDAHGSTFHIYRSEPRYFPTFYLIDKNGRIHWIGEGEMTYDDLEAQILEVI